MSYLIVQLIALSAQDAENSNVEIQGVDVFLILDERTEETHRLDSPICEGITHERRHPHTFICKVD